MTKPIERTDLDCTAPSHVGYRSWTAGCICPAVAEAHAVKLDRDRASSHRRRSSAPACMDASEPDYTAVFMAATGRIGFRQLASEADRIALVADLARDRSIPAIAAECGISTVRVGQLLAARERVAA